MQKLNYKDIEKHYDSEWVLLSDLEVDKYDQIKSATVLWHGEDRDELHRQAMSLPHGGRIATLFIGDLVPKDVAVIL